MIDRDRIRALADQRRTYHDRHRTIVASRSITGRRDRVYLGLLGEFTFAALAGLDVDERLLPDGDAGFDFETFVGRIDVKTTTVIPGYAPTLFVRYEPLKADIYVLCGYAEATDTCWCVGWTTADVVEDSPLREYGYGVPCYTIESAGLRPIDDLLRLLNGDDDDNVW